MAKETVFQCYFVVPDDTLWSELPQDFVAEFDLLNEIYPGDKAAGSVAEHSDKLFHCVIESISPDLKTQLETMLISFDLDTDWSLAWLSSAWDIIVDVVENPGTEEETITHEALVLVAPERNVMSRFFAPIVEGEDLTGENCSVYQGHTKPVLV